jgi:putative addiction module component (TIGR02574 family)
MNTYDDVLGAAQGLPPLERLRLVHELWATVEPKDWPPPGEDWIEEARQRSTAYDAGQITASPWRDVRARARRKAGLDE